MPFYLYHELKLNFLYSLSFISVIDSSCCSISLFHAVTTAKSCSEACTCSWSLCPISIIHFGGCVCWSACILCIGICFRGLGVISFWTFMFPKIVSWKIRRNSWLLTFIRLLILFRLFWLAVLFLILLLLIRLTTFTAKNMIDFFVSPIHIFLSYLFATIVTCDCCSFYCRLSPVSKISFILYAVLFVTWWTCRITWPLGGSYYYLVLSCWEGSPVLLLESVLAPFPLNKSAYFS